MMVVFKLFFGAAIFFQNGRHIAKIVNYCTDFNENLYLLVIWCGEHDGTIKLFSSQNSSSCSAYDGILLCFGSQVSDSGSLEPLVMSRKESLGGGYMKCSPCALNIYKGILATLVIERNNCLNMIWHHDIWFSEATDGINRKCYESSNFFFIVYGRHYRENVNFVRFQWQIWYLGGILIRRTWRFYRLCCFEPPFFFTKWTPYRKAISTLSDFNEIYILG